MTVPSVAERTLEKNRLATDPGITPWTRVLYAVVRRVVGEELQRKGKHGSAKLAFADVGAGPIAAIASFLAEDFGRGDGLAIWAVEPNFDLADRCRTIGADFWQTKFEHLPDSLVFDLIAFNPPVAPHSFLEYAPKEVCALYDGGETGKEVLEAVVEAIPRHLASGGQAAILWPTLLPPPQDLAAAAGLLETHVLDFDFKGDSEAIERFAQRFPVDYTRNEFRSWLSESVKKHLDRWLKLIAGLDEDSIGLPVALFREKG